MWTIVLATLLAVEAPEGMVLIPGGAFVRGNDNGPKNERPSASVNVSSFFMDVYEVTVVQFDACVSAKACKPATSQPPASAP